MNSAIENQIREREARLYAAMLASNVDELNALIADDLLFVGPTGELATKEMDLEPLPKYFYQKKSLQSGREG